MNGSTLAGTAGDTIAPEFVAPPPRLAARGRGPMAGAVGPLLIPFCTAGRSAKGLLRVARGLGLVCLGLCGQSGGAVELPAPEQLARELGIHPQSVAVIEPHESDARHEITINYTAFPLDTLLDRWFGSRWSVPDAEVLFLAHDGYRSAIAAESFKQERAFLAFRRTDDAAFVVNNPEQNQTGVPLGPYYLIWDNRASADRLTRGTYGWVYQVASIDVRSAHDDRKLLPSQAGPEIAKGFADAKRFCLSCHSIRGIGGRKFPSDLVLASCRWTDGQLKSWIRDPAQLRPGTSMPALNRGFPSVEREQIIDHIVAYLQAMKRDAAACVATPEVP